MASASKPTYTKPIPEGAKRFKPKGRPAVVKYIDKRGKRHERRIRLDSNGKETDTMICQQSYWWMRYKLADGTERREKGYKDKTATEQEAARREREAAQIAAGVITVDSKHAATSFNAHLDAYVADLERAGRAPKHYELVKSRLKRMAKACNWQTLRAITPDTMNRFLVELKRQNAAGKTMNEYLMTAKAFCNWCVRSLRITANPLASVVKTGNVQKGYNRRALTENEARKLLNIAGPRRLVYLVAMNTGLRRGELKQLQWGDLRIGDGVRSPHIALRAFTTKARRADNIPLRSDLTQELRNARPDNANPIDRVFKSIPKMETFKSDLAKAGIPHVDPSGRVMDFHALRYTCGTMLAKAGVAPRVAMEIMRHKDISLTMNLYTDPRILDTANAVEQIPSLIDRPDNEKIAALRTGTDNMMVEKDFLNPLQKVLTKSLSGSVLWGPKLAKTTNSQAKKTPINKGFSNGGGGNRTRVP